MADKLVFSAEAIMLCVTALIFSADKDAFTKDVDFAPELAKPGAITFDGYATLVNANVITLWVCVKKRFNEAGALKVKSLKNGEAEMALDSDEAPHIAVAPAPTATTGLSDNSRLSFESLLLSSLSKSCTICSDMSLTS
jgi:hypothetical protein